METDTQQIQNLKEDQTNPYNSEKHLNNTRDKIATWGLIGLFVLVIGILLVVYFSDIDKEQILLSLVQVIFAVAMLMLGYFFGSNIKKS